jgi:hypothetical protein
MLTHLNGADIYNCSEKMKGVNSENRPFNLNADGLYPTILGILICLEHNPE